MKNIKINIVILVACAPVFMNAQVGNDRTLEEKITVTSDDKNVTLQFNTKDNYKIYEGTSVQLIDWKNPKTVENTNTYSTTKNSLRPFFAVITAKNDTIIVAERKIPFNKTSNFRDLGGIKTQDGRFVKWGKFYRSDAMASFTEEELNRYASLNVAKVFDMRSTNEVKQAPNQLPNGVQNIHVPIFDEMHSSMFAGIEEKMKKGTLTEKEAAELLIVGNQQFAKEYAEKFKNILQQLVTTDRKSVV